ncbi:MAG: nitroreductase family protein [candidate division Zixibacteria bacterium]|nr:nitroreductase family protein [candidate division Zixibacteria bacterium]
MHDEPSHHGIDDDRAQSYPNPTMQLLLQRASCRSFEDKPIPDDVMRLVLEAGIHAPTGGNLQPYSIIKSDNKQTAAKLAKLCGEQPWIADAATNLLFCIDWRRLERWAELEIAPFAGMAAFRNFWITFQDVIISAQNICTAADTMGLGSVYIGTVMECFRELVEMFKLPKGVFPVVLLCLGYPKQRPLPRRKLGVDIVVHDETYHEPNDKTIREAYQDKYPNWKLQITEERLEIMRRVCRNVHGDEFADRCIEKVKAQGYFSPVQNYFGLHYQADFMPQGNEEFLAMMEERGFTWFKNYVPKGMEYQS